MALDIDRERFSDVMPELPELFVQHYYELAPDRDFSPLAPNWDKYLALEKAGTLHTLTVRSEGKLVGYAFLMCAYGLHFCSTPMAWVDVMYLKPECRKGFAGVNIIKSIVHLARALGVKRLYIVTKAYHDLGKVFSRMGFTLEEHNYSITL